MPSKPSNQNFIKTIRKLYTNWHKKHVPLEVQGHLFNAKRSIKTIYIFVVVVIIWNNRCIILLEPVICFDSRHIYSHYRIWIKNSFQNVLSTRREPLGNLGFSLGDLNQAREKIKMNHWPVAEKNSISSF